RVNLEVRRGVSQRCHYCDCPRRASMSTWYVTEDLPSLNRTDLTTRAGAILHRDCECSEILSPYIRKKLSSERGFADILLGSKWLQAELVAAKSTEKNDGVLASRIPEAGRRHGRIFDATPCPRPSLSGAADYADRSFSRRRPNGLHRARACRTHARIAWANLGY